MYVWKTLPYFPPLRWGRTYRKEWIFDDIVAGLFAERDAFIC